MLNVGIRRSTVIKIHHQSALYELCISYTGTETEIHMIRKVKLESKLAVPCCAVLTTMNL